MSAHEALLERMRSSNPVPNPGRSDQDELSVVFDVLQERRVVMATTTHRTRPSPAPSTGRRHRPGWAFAAAFTLTVVMVGVAALLFRGEARDPDGSVASISLVPESWSQVSAEATDPVVGLSGIVDIGGRLVAVGWDPGDDYLQNGVTFISEDGLTWERAAELDEALTRGGAFLVSATEFRNTLVAVGWSCVGGDAGCIPVATSWTSSDGIAWTRSATDAAVFGDGELEAAFMSEVVATDNGVVAVGFVEYRGIDEAGMRTGATIHPAAWTSSDGLVWERSFEGPGTSLDMDDYRGPTMAVAAGTNGRLVLVASMFGDQGEFIGVVWTSDDGREWQRVPHDSGVFAADGRDLMMWDVIDSDGGFVAVGGEDSAKPVVWTSPDGLDWTRVALNHDQFGFDGSLAAVTAGGDGYLAVGPVMYNEANNPVTAWTSADGVSWRLVFQSENDGYATEIVAIDEGVVISGATLRSNDFHASIWVGPAGS